MKVLKHIPYYTELTWPMFSCSVRMPCLAERPKCERSSSFSSVACVTFWEVQAKHAHTQFWKSVSSVSQISCDTDRQLLTSPEAAMLLFPHVWEVQQSISCNRKLQLSVLRETVNRGLKGCCDQCEKKIIWGCSMKCRMKKKDLHIIIMIWDL